MIYETQPEFDLYGYSKTQLSDPIQYLLSVAQNQDNKNIIRNYSKNVVSSDKDLNNTIKSKYNLLRQKEPQSIGGSKKRFTFKR